MANPRGQRSGGSWRVGLASRPQPPVSLPAYTKINTLLGNNRPRCGWFPRISYWTLRGFAVRLTAGPIQRSQLAASSLFLNVVGLVMSHANHKTKSLVRWTLRRGLAASLLLHAGLLTVMLIGFVRSRLDQRPIRIIQASSAYVKHAGQDVATPTTVVINEDDPAPTNIQQKFEASLAATEQLDEAERIEALDNATNRLARISSETSLDEVAKRLQSWLDLTPRAEKPMVEHLAPQEDPTAAEGRFDFDTAQLHDVKRVLVPDSRPQYLCVLLDARGRTIEVPLSEAEGEPIYFLMEKIKAHPFLEQIYRQLAMPLLDQMVKAERTATAAASAATSKTGASEVARAVPRVEPLEDKTTSTKSQAANHK